MSDCAQFRELLGGYVLQALEPEEAASLREHLEACPRCRREHAELAGVPAVLDLLDDPEAEPQAPPARLEEAILDRFAREHRGLRPLRRPRRRSWRLRLGVAGAVAAAVAALAVAGVFSSSKENSAYGHVHLRGASGSRAYASLTALRAGTGVRLAVDGLPATRGRVYELWCIADDGRWISGGTFHVDKRGHARVSTTSAARPGEYELMLVTRPADGEHGPKLLSGEVEY